MQAGPFRLPANRSGRARSALRKTLVRRSGRTGPHALLAFGQLPVSPDVAVLASENHVHGVVVAGVADLTDRRRVDARDASRVEDIRASVAELHLDRAP